MTPLENEIIKVLQETKRGKGFVKNWRLKKGDWLWDDLRKRLEIVKSQAQAQEIQDLAPVKEYHIKCCTILPSEPQMLDAIGKTRCLWSLHACGTIYDSEGLKETKPSGYYIKISRRPLEIRRRSDTNVFEGKTHLEAVQRAFLAVVLKEN